MTSLNSGLLTNFKSIREPFGGCKIGAFIDFILSQPKQVAKISANNNVVPSFYNKHKTNKMLIDLSILKTFNYRSQQTYFAKSKYVKQQWQAFRYKL